MIPPSCYFKVYIECMRGLKIPPFLGAEPGHPAGGFILRSVTWGGDLLARTKSVYPATSPDVFLTDTL